MSKTIPIKPNHSIHYTDPLISKRLSDLIISFLPHYPSPVILLCIGTDRSTGDSLGPLTGTFIEKLKPVHLKLYGTLHDPVHALNLEDKIQMIYSKYDKPFIIAVDASLGRLKSIGHITSSSGPLIPGAAFNKGLPAVGNAHITGVVNVSGMMEYNVLQSTKLSLVYDMAWTLSRIMLHVEIWLERYHQNINKKGRHFSHIPSFKINGRYIE